MQDPVIQSLNNYYANDKKINNTYEHLIEHFKDSLDGFLFCADTGTIYGFLNIESLQEFIQDKDECQQFIKELDENDIDLADVEWVLENSSFRVFYSKEDAETFYANHVLANDNYELEEW